jgi:hypothetical protein
MIQIHTDIQDTFQSQKSKQTNKVYNKNVASWIEIDWESGQLSLYSDYVMTGEGGV